MLFGNFKFDAPSFVKKNCSVTFKVSLAETRTCLERFEVFNRCCKKMKEQFNRSTINRRRKKGDRRYKTDNTPHFFFERIYANLLNSMIKKKDIKSNAQVGLDTYTIPLHA